MEIASCHPKYFSKRFGRIDTYPYNLRQAFVQLVALSRARARLPSSVRLPATTLQPSRTHALKSSLQLSRWSAELWQSRPIDDV